MSPSEQARPAGRAEQRPDDAEPADGEAEEEEGGGDQDDGAPVDLADRLALAGDEALDDDEDPQADEHGAQHERDVAGHPC